MLAIGGCGRLGFDASGGTSSGDAGLEAAVDAPTAGSPGARWLQDYGPTGTGTYDGVFVAGVGGEVVAVKSFQSALVIDGMTLTGQSPFGSTAVTRLDAIGTIISTAVLDATGWCEGRHVTMRGTDALVTGLTIGTMSNPAFGPCSIVTNRQDPFVVRVERSGQPHLAGHWSSGGANAQGWWSAPLSDGTVIITGIYGANLTIGTPLPTATVDPSMFIARFTEGVSAPVWAYGGSSSSAQIHAGPIAAEANDLCAIGSFNGPVTLFGNALPHAGNFDAWVARLDPSGTPRWIRAIGSTGAESNFGNSSIAVAPGGGCYISLDAPADLTANSMTFPALDGRAVLLELNGSGMVVGGIRLPARAQLAIAGGRLYAALEVTATLTSGAVSYTPMGRDIVVVEVGAAGLARVVGALGGAGDQKLWSMAAVADDALAIGAASTGQLVFGSSTTSTPAMTDLIAVIGI